VNIMKTKRTIEDILFEILFDAKTYIEQIWHSGDPVATDNGKSIGFYTVLHKLLNWMKAIESVIDEKPSRW